MATSLNLPWEVVFSLSVFLYARNVIIFLFYITIQIKFIANAVTQAKIATINKLFSLKAIIQATIRPAIDEI